MRHYRNSVEDKNAEVIKQSNGECQCFGDRGRGILENSRENKRRINRRIMEPRK